MKIVNVRLTDAQIRELIKAGENRLWSLRLYNHGKKKQAIMTRAIVNLTRAIGF